MLELDRTLIGLLRIACKGDKLQRGLDTVQLLHLLPSFDTAEKVAGFFHLMGLQEKIGKMKRHRMQEEEEQEDRIANSWDNVSKPVARPEFETANGRRHSRPTFEEFSPPSAVRRRAVELATPIYPTSKAAPPTQPARIADWGEVATGFSSEPESLPQLADAGGKRKRPHEENEDDGGPAWDAVADEAGPSTKKRVADPVNSKSLFRALLRSTVFPNVFA